MGNTDHRTPEIAVWAAIRGYQACCDCGWDDRPRWFRFRAVDMAWQHHIDTGHDLCEPLVIDLPFEVGPPRGVARRVRYAVTSWPVVVLSLLIPMVVGLLVFATPAAASPVSDRAFIDTLDFFGVYYSSETAALTAGYGVCFALDDGMTVDDVAEIGVTSGGYTDADAGYFVGAAIGALCPEHRALVDIPVRAV